MTIRILKKREKNSPGTESGRLYDMEDMTGGNISRTDLFRNRASLAVSEQKFVF